jgi:hypothetical protein
MGRGFRIFLFVFAAAVTAVAIGSYLHAHEHSIAGFSTQWLLIGSTACSYLVLAFAYLYCKEPSQAPTPKWLAILFAVALSQLIVSYVATDVFGFRYFLQFIGLRLVPFCAFLGVTAFLLSGFPSKASAVSGRLRRILIPASLLTSAALVLSSLFLRTTFNDSSDGTGWNVITHHAHWVTTEANVAHGVFFGSTINWLDTLYAHAGFPIYSLSLIATILTVLGLVASRMSTARFQASSFFRLSSAIAILASLWVITDIFWGWHFDLSSVTWAAVIATGLWLATPIFGVALLLPVIRGALDVWRLRALLLFQFPLVAFNVLMLPVYFQSDEPTHLPGLGCLILGLLIQSWACMEVLARRANRSANEVRPRKPALAA